MRGGGGGGAAVRASKIPHRADFDHIMVHSTQQYTYTDSSQHITRNTGAKAGVIFWFSCFPNPRKSLTPFTPSQILLLSNVATAVEQSTNNFPSTASDFWLISLRIGSSPKNVSVVADLAACSSASHAISIIHARVWKKRAFIQAPFKPDIEECEKIARPDGWPWLAYSRHMWCGTLSVPRLHEEFGSMHATQVKPKCA